MDLSDISFSNLKRRKGRTVFLVAIVFIAVTLMVAVLTITQGMRREMNWKLNQFGANVVVVPRTLDISLSYGRTVISTVTSEVGELTMTDANKISSIRVKESLRGVSPKLIQEADIEGRRCIVVGMSFPDELKMKPYWEIEGEPPHGSLDALLGNDIARDMKKKAGDTINIKGQDFRVSGVLKKQLNQDDLLIMGDIREIGMVFGKPGKVSIIEVAGWCAACPVETIAEQIEKKLPHAKAMVIRQLVQAEIATVDLADRFSILLIGTILVAGCAMMFTTMMSSVVERTREIGVLRAIGFRQSHLMRIVMQEALIVSIIGGFVGIVIGNLAAKVLGEAIAGLEAVRFSPVITISALALALVMGIVPTIYPARKAAQMDPTEALRAL
ncbi:ABC transporter permease [Chloroflexota bacterium]